jgi:hypothetical protein
VWVLDRIHAQIFVFANLYSFHTLFVASKKQWWDCRWQDFRLWRLWLQSSNLQSCHVSCNTGIWIWPPHTSLAKFIYLKIWRYINGTRISAMYSSMLGLPMMYITQISSNSSVFETIRINKSMDTCPILASIEYSYSFWAQILANMNIRIFASICDICEYLPSKYECECEYWIAYVREYSYLRIYTRSIPWYCVDLKYRLTSC